MKGCLFVAGNSYLWALLFFAVVMQIILLPIAIKQQKSQIMMAKIKPKEMAIREKYKGRTDRVTQQKMTMEIQQMYQKEGYNQFGGCLPLLIQLPIILILFTIVRQPITYASNLTNDNANFVKENAAIAVEFYQQEKEALIKDKFETVAEYNEYVALIDNYQSKLGSEKQKDKNENGFNVFTVKDGAVIDESALSRLIIDGKEEIETLVNDGKIDSSFIAKYEETKLGTYRDSLPNYKIFNLNLINEPDFGPNIWLMIVPILVFLSSWLSTKLMRRFSPQQTDANGNPIGGGLFMEVGMPLMSAIFAYSFSAAIGVYWIWRTVISILQSYIMSKAMPIPAVTEEQIAEARREMKTKQKKKKVITIEVDEDDDSYDSLVVEKKSAPVSEDVTTRKPRTVEMLTADDEDEN